VVPRGGHHNRGRRCGSLDRVEPRASYRRRSRARPTARRPPHACAWTGAVAAGLLPGAAPRRPRSSRPQVSPAAGADRRGSPRHRPWSARRRCHPAESTPAVERRVGADAAGVVVPGGDGRPGRLAGQASGCVAVDGVAHAELTVAVVSTTPQSVIGLDAARVEAARRDGQPPFRRRRRRANAGRQQADNHGSAQDQPDQRPTTHIAPRDTVTISPRCATTQTNPSARSFQKHNTDDRSIRPGGLGHKPKIRYARWCPGRQTTFRRVADVPGAAGSGTGACPAARLRPVC
jgi:hypothetical protein